MTRTSTTRLCIQVNPGDHLPGVPRHRFKAGADYWVTTAWSVGADVVAASDQVVLRRRRQRQPPLGGYAKVDIRTSYNITENVQIYGMVDNVFDSRYGLFGNFFNRRRRANAGRADGLAGDDFFEDATTARSRRRRPSRPTAASR